MIAVMHPGATTEDIEHVVEVLRLHNLKAQISAGRGAHRDRRHRHRVPRRSARNARGPARRGPRHAHHPPVQARQPRLQATRHRRQGGRATRRRARVRGHGRAVLGREPRATACAPPQRGCLRRDAAARRRLQAAHLAVRLPGPGRGRPRPAGRGPRADRPADHHRGHGARPGRARRRVGRRAADRRPQHAELPAAQGGRPHRTSRACSSAACRPRSRSG